MTPEKDRISLEGRKHLKVVTKQCLYSPDITVSLFRGSKGVVYERISFFQEGGKSNSIYSEVTLTNFHCVMFLK